MDPELIREVLIKFNEFPKQISNPLVRFLSTGLVSYAGEQWVKHRKLLNPAFHQEKLKVFLTILTAFSSQFFFLTLWAVPYSHYIILEKHVVGRKIFFHVYDQIILIIIKNKSSDKQPFLYHILNVNFDTFLLVVVATCFPNIFTLS